MAKAKAKFNFEEGMKQLEDILDKISNPDTSLDESIELYANAAELINQCNTTLQNAQVRIEEITKGIQVSEEKDEL